MASKKTLSKSKLKSQAQLKAQSAKVKEAKLYGETIVEEAELERFPNRTPVS